MRKKNKTIENELEKVRSGIFLSVIITLAATALALAGNWVVKAVVITALFLLFLIAFIASLPKKWHSDEYNQLKPIQKVFSNMAVILELLSYIR